MDIRIKYWTKKTAVVSYADEVTSFVTAPADIPMIRDHLLTFERATGACLNIPYYQDITIHGFEFKSAVARSVYLTCSRATGKIKALATDA